jgi:hypothetical protein
MGPTPILRVSYFLKSQKFRALRAKFLPCTFSMQITLFDCQIVWAENLNYGMAFIYCMIINPLPTC